MPTAPGLAHWIPLPFGSFRAFMRDPLVFLLEARERFGDVFRYRIGPMVVHFLFHPAHVQHVLADHQKNYLRGWHYRLTQRLAGTNLVVSEGDLWRRQRRLAQPAFQRQRLATYLPTMTDATLQMLERWQTLTSVDIGIEMKRLALAIAGRTLFDRDISAEADEVGQSFGVVARYLEYRFNHVFTSLPIWVPTPTNRRFRKALHALNTIVLGLIQERRRDGRDHGDLLSMLMRARDEETDAVMSDDQLRGETLAFLIAGHETTATALTWVCYLLATHPDLYRRARDEAMALNGRTSTSAELAGLTVIRNIITESMRLYPPIWAVARQAIQADQVSGFDIPKGSTIILSPFVTHRHPAFWDRPNDFDPERFTPERSAERPKLAYFPFLAGPHQCIGNEFALLEMQLIVALILRRFDLEPMIGPIRPRGALVLRPDAAIQLRVRKSGAIS